MRRGFVLGWIRDGIRHQQGAHDGDGDGKAVRLEGNIGSRGDGRRIDVRDAGCEGIGGRIRRRVASRLTDVVARLRKRGIAVLARELAGRAGPEIDLARIVRNAGEVPKILPNESAPELDSRTG